MDEEAVNDALERLFASTNAEELARAFATMPALRVSAARKRLEADIRAAENEELRAFARARLGVWRLARAGDYAGASSVFEAALTRLVNEVLNPHVEDLLAEMEHHRAKHDWTALTESAGQLLRLTHDAGPPALQVEALRAIAQAAFADMSEGRGEAIDTAIRCWERILEIVDEHEGFDWDYIRPIAITNLGTCFGARVYGDPRINQERAIAYQRMALALITIESDGDGWAMAHTNLGLSLLHHADELRTGETDPQDLHLPGDDVTSDMDVPSNIVESSNDIEQAIAHFEAALQWRSFERDAGDWAYTETNLGVAFGRRRKGDPRGNIEAALGHYRNAERGFAAAGLDHLRAVALHDQASEMLRLANLAGTVADERDRLLDEALVAAEAAVADREIALAPVEIGRSWSLLGAVLSSMGRRGDAQQAYMIALQGLTPLTAPRLCRDTARDLASIAAEEGDWSASADAWDVAAEAANRASGARATSRGRFAELSENQNVHRWAAYAATRAGRPERAIELLESGRSREIVRLVGPDAHQLERLQARAPEHAQRYLALDTRLGAIERDLRAGLVISEKEAAQVTEALATTVAAVREIVGFERFLEPPRFSDIAAVAGAQEALVYLLTAPAGSLGLIVLDGDVRVIDVRSLTSTQAFGAFLSIDEESESVLGYYVAHRAGLEQLDRALDHAASLIAEPLLRPVADELRAAGVSKVCLIPVALLGLLPLHALSWVENERRRCLLDDVSVTVAPSGFVHAICQQRAAQYERAPRRLLVVADPESSEEPLANAHLEAAAIRNALPTESTTLLLREEATKVRVTDELRDSSFAHFACHGTGAVLGEPFDSGLLLAPDDLWTAIEILDQRPIHARLVVASACETGVIQGGASATDEVISLATVFIAAGAAGCVATLWSVSDYATALLMSRFYEEMADGSAPNEALRAAQLWLRDLTPEAEAAHVAARGPLRGYTAPHNRSGDDGICRTVTAPYASPVFWAPFVVSGA